MKKHKMKKPMPAKEDKGTAFTISKNVCPKCGKKVPSWYKKAHNRFHDIEKLKNIKEMK